MFFEYAKMVGETLWQILTVIGRGIVVLFACGFAAAILFLIEFIVSLAIPKKITDKDWFTNFVIVTCMIAGLAAAIATATALFNF